MASACVNNVAVPHSSYGCFSPRISFSRDFPSDNGSDPADPNNAGPELDPKDLIDFEFHLNDPVAMLPADELFSDGKLVPLHLTHIKPAPDSDPDPDHTAGEILLPDTPLKPLRREQRIGSGADSFAVSPKAPTCSSRWRELLRLKRQQQTSSSSSKPDPGTKNQNPKSLKQFLNRNLRSSSSSSSSSDPNLSLPLLKDSETEPISISSRLSLSSTSSSGPEPEPEDLPRLSLDAENKPNQNPILLNRNPPKVRVSRAGRTGPDGRVPVRAGRSPVRRPSAEAVAPPPRCASVDSPRMNASGKVVFQGLGRSSSSPSTFTGGPRIKQHRSMERSYSSNVRVTPVLNVPVCSLRGGSKSFGFGQLFSGSGSGSGSSSKTGNNINNSSKGKN